VTQYESLSLSLLTTIADGSMLQLTRPPEHDEARKRRHDELVRNFRKGTEELVEVVAEAIRTKPEAAPPAAPDVGPASA
jgi:hypothetical protein